MALKGQLPPRKKDSEFRSDDMKNMIKSQLEDNQNIPKKQNLPEKKNDYHIMMKPSLHDKGIKYANSQGISFSELVSNLIENTIK